LADIRISYYDGRTSPLHRIDPRTKLVWIMWVFGMITVLLDPRYQTLIVASVVIAATAGRIRAGDLLRAGRIGVYVGLVSWVLWIVFLPGTGRPLLHIVGRPVTDVGVMTGLSVAIRIIAILFAFLIVAMTTPTRHLITGLHRLHVPKVFALAVGMVLRMIPQLQSEHRVIVEAQRSRGIEFDGGSLMTRLRRHMSYLIPLAVRSLKIVHDMGIAMDARAFDPSADRTFQPVLRFGRSDVILLTLMAISLAGSVALRIAGHEGAPS
jgi:energy-coupling factor transport system permease protein